jgi:hypothetical protein
VYQVQASDKRDLILLRQVRVASKCEREARAFASERGTRLGLDWTTGECWYTQPTSFGLIRPRSGPFARSTQVS